MKFLVKKQFGFREKHSTYMAILDLVDTISQEIDSKNYFMGIFIDLSKAFDTIHHTILIDKLAYYGIRGVALQCFISYLSIRSQYVKIGDICSNYLHLTCGVPQGSTLGPLLFHVYINDIVNVSALVDFLMFADDTNLFISSHSLESLCVTANTVLAKLAKWFRLNKLF